MSRLSFLQIFAASLLLYNVSATWNGTTVDVQSFPQTVSIKRYNDAGIWYRCVGTILNEKFVLTAAHCTADSSPASTFTIEFGKNEAKNIFGSNIRRIIKFIVHPNYNFSTYANDIAIAELEDPIEFSDTVQPTELPPAGSSIPIVSDANAIGYNARQLTFDEQIGRKPHPNKTLTLIEVQMFSETDCAGFHNGNAIPEYHFCASNPKEKVGVCWGDCGGPLFVNGVQFGVLSRPVRPCGRPGQPPIYTKVPQYVEWIIENSTL